MDLNLADTRFWLQAGLFGLLALAAWRVGGGPERVLAGVLVWFSVADSLNHRLFDVNTDYLTTDTGHVIIDAVALVVSLAVALTANRMYPLWFAALQLLAMLAHLSREVTHGTAAIAYLVMYIGPSYGQIVVLALGIWAHHRRVRRHGPYRSWRNFSSHLPGKAPPTLRSG